MSALSAARLSGPRFFAAVLAIGLVAATSAQAEPLGLETALSRAAAADPRREAGQARLLAADAATRIAGLKPAAAIDLEVENLLGTGAYSGLARADATVAYEQTWERGGKREARLDLAKAERAVVLIEQDIRRLDHLREVQAAYATALAAEAAAVTAEARLVSAGQSQAEIDRRVKSARDPLFAGARAETLTAQAQIARDQTLAAALAARRALAAYWGGSADFELPVASFFSVDDALPPIQADPPALSLLAARREAALAAVRVEQAAATRDPTLRGGVRYLGDTSDAALVVGATLPLGQRSRMTASLDRALAMRNAAEADLAIARADHVRELASLRTRLTAAALESERIRAEVIPVALRTLDLVRDGFARGGFNYDDVTGAERALAEARERRVTVLAAWHLDLAAYDRLVGRHAALLSSAAELRP